MLYKVANLQSNISQLPFQECCAILFLWLGITVTPCPIFYTILKEYTLETNLIFSLSLVEKSYLKIRILLFSFKQDLLFETDLSYKFRNFFNIKVFMHKRIPVQNDPIFKYSTDYLVKRKPVILIGIQLSDSLISSPLESQSMKKTLKAKDSE